MKDKDAVYFSLEIVMTKENLEDLHTRFELVEDKQRWSVCETMWCCKKCSEKKGVPHPCKCSEIQVVTNSGEVSWMPTHISCDGCGTSWKPAKLSVTRK